MRMAISLMRRSDVACGGTRKSGYRESSNACAAQTGMDASKSGRREQKRRWRVESFPIVTVNMSPGGEAH
jgi:hypothetical protein